MIYSVFDGIVLWRLEASSLGNTWQFPKVNQSSTEDLFGCGWYGGSTEPIVNTWHFGIWDERAFVRGFASLCFRWREVERDEKFVTASTIYTKCTNTTRGSFLMGSKVSFILLTSISQSINLLYIVFHQTIWRNEKHRRLAYLQQPMLV
mmetsp:Transcript_30408/g.72914  ORF Transcript_30408/g.72914 Transcript_30408/m.72914 type:complete len:149 (+) Transcript_30408:1736-2182(+)